MKRDADPLGRLLAAISGTDEETWRWVCRAYGLPEDTQMPAVVDEDGGVAVAE